MRGKVVSGVFLPAAALLLVSGSQVSAQENLALLGTAAQSSQLGGFGPERAIDGDLGNFTHTQAGQVPGIWEVDLMRWRSSRVRACRLRRSFTAATSMAMDS